MYVFRFRMLAFVLIFSLCFSVPAWAVTYSDLYDSVGYAKQVDTYSIFPRVSSSNASVTPYFNDAIMPASSVGSVTNTVDFSGCNVNFFDSNWSWVGVSYVSLGGTFSYVVPSGSNVKYMEIQFSPSASLPVSGRYKYEVDFSSDTSLVYNSVQLCMIWSGKNVGSQKRIYDVTNVTQSSGDLYFSVNIDLATSVSKFYESIGFSETVSAGGAIGGRLAASFNLLPAGVDVDTITPGAAPSTSDIQSGIASTTNQISYSVNQVYDSILALTQHISDQLAAFWDQLYNYIHVPTFNKLQDILQAIQAIQLKVNVDVSSVVDAVDTSADRITDTVNSAINNQISNDNKNTDDLKNGYDNSGMLSDNDRLNDKISQYDDVENQLFNDAKDKIGNFTFDNPLSKYTAVLSDISYFLAGIYDGLGALNIPIAFSLTLTIALIFIGYYRFKGGV